MTTMEAYLTAEILLDTRGPDGAERHARHLLAEAQAKGDRPCAEEWASIRQALVEMS